MKEKKKKGKKLKVLAGLSTVGLVALAVGYNNKNKKKANVETNVESTDELLSDVVSSGEIL